MKKWFALAPIVLVSMIYSAADGDNVADLRIHFLYEKEVSGAPPHIFLHKNLVTTTVGELKEAIVDELEDFGLVVGELWNRDDELTNDTFSLRKAGVLRRPVGFTEEIVAEVYKPYTKSYKAGY